MRFNQRAVVILFIIYIRRICTTSNVPLTHATIAGKIACFHCHMPVQCSSGLCYGDLCVKSLVGDSYVSKGCENRSANSYPRTLSGISDRNDDTQCVESDVFGFKNKMCFCNSNFCNMAISRSLNNFTFLSLLLYLLLA